MFVTSLVTWYGEHARRLPWRGDVSPYAVWVSEVMCQQTRVETVVPYFERWMRALPTVDALAGASDELVASLWAGLGYYRRARLLHTGAKLVADTLNGALPRSVASLMLIPGIGRYTAGAIASIAFGVAAPAVDGNVCRVLSRVRAVRSRTGRKDFQDWAWRAASSLVGLAGDAPGAFNQSLMELGATVCTPRSPACGDCPVASLCAATRCATGGSCAPASELPADVSRLCRVCDWTHPRSLEPLSDVAGVPFTRERKVVPQRHLWAAVLERPQADGGSEVLLLRRAHNGLLAGQWEVPVVDVGDAGDGGGAAPEPRSCQAELSVHVGDVTGCDMACATRRVVAGHVKHVFTHRVHHIIVEHVLVPCDWGPPAGASIRWVAVGDVESLGPSTWLRKVLVAGLRTTRPLPAWLTKGVEEASKCRAEGRGKRQPHSEPPSGAPRKRPRVRTT